MAARLLPKSSRVTAYLPNLNAAVQHFRAFSTYPGRDTRTTIFTDDYHNDPPIFSTELGPLGPQDRRFPLPGHVGINSTPVFRPINLQPANIDNFLQDTAEKQRSEILKQVEERIEEHYTPEATAADNLECVAQMCPDLMKKDIQELFPARDLSRSNLTVIIISQKTQNDMTGWSPDVEDEREELLAAFIDGARHICYALEEAGYWADFIDPSCGKPHLGPHTNATLFETDERYRKFGFEIDDLGCCKVIRHHLWGTHSYVGSLFTDAPLDHPIISAMKLKDN